MPDKQSDLFSPVRLGPYTLNNRIVMAPLTRARAGSDGVVKPMHATYYRQRAGAGLIVSEATNISPQARGYAWTPGIHTPLQVRAWRTVTEAVHSAGGRIVCQLWHVGRISHPDLQPDGGLPVAPSAVPVNEKAFTEQGMQPIPTPRALAREEIPGIIEQYRHAANCALEAGFDGVEIHAANNYLLEQFIRDSTNQRADDYGGSAANRIRLTLEVVEAVTGVWGGERVGIRLSPVTAAVGNTPLDSDVMGTYGLLLRELNRFRLMYVHMIEGSTRTTREAPQTVDLGALRRLFDGPYIANNLYTRELALQARREKSADLVCFGRPFIANPDLVERLRKNAPLAEAPPDCYYGGGEEGYTDWPSMDGSV